MCIENAELKILIEQTKHDGASKLCKIYLSLWGLLENDHLPVVD